MGVKVRMEHQSIVNYAPVQPPNESIKYQDLRSHSEANLSLLGADLSANSNCSQLVQQPARMVSPD